MLRGGMCVRRRSVIHRSETHFGHPPTLWQSHPYILLFPLLLLLLINWFLLDLCCMFLDGKRWGRAPTHHWFEKGWILAGQEVCTERRCHQSIGICWLFSFKSLLYCAARSCDCPDKCKGSWTFGLVERGGGYKGVWGEAIGEFKDNGRDW